MWIACFLCIINAYIDYQEEHDVLFVHIFLDSLKSPAKFQPFQSQLSRNFASPIMHIFGKCRGPHAMTFCHVTTPYLFWRQGAAAPLRPPFFNWTMSKIGRVYTEKPTNTRGESARRAPLGHFFTKPFQRRLIGKGGGFRFSYRSHTPKCDFTAIYYIWPLSPIHLLYFGYFHF